MITHDHYRIITKQYRSTKGLIPTDEFQNGEPVLMPVTFEGWLYNRRILIHDDKDQVYSLPEILTGYYDQLLGAHRKSNIYDNITIRVNEWKETGDSFHIYTGRTTYFNTLVTNRAMDHLLEGRITVRKLYEKGPCINSLSESVLSNHLGFNGFVESSDNSIMLVRRSGNLSVGKGMWGNSISASLKTMYALDGNSGFTPKGLQEGILMEIEDELNIHKDNLVKSRENKVITILSAYRDLVEGGKPHLVFYARSSLSAKEMDEAFRSNRKELERQSETDAKELSSRRKAELDVKMDGRQAVFIRREDLLHNTVVFTEGAVINGNTFPMTPSYAACLLMLRNCYESM